MINLKCDCGNDNFHVATSGKMAMCGKCHAVYDKQGNKIKISDPFNFKDIEYQNIFVPVKKRK